jgi:hypothetical protein
MILLRFEKFSLRDDPHRLQLSFGSQRAEKEIRNTLSETSRGLSGYVAAAGLPTLFIVFVQGDLQGII